MKIKHGLTLLFFCLFGFFLYRMIPIALASRWNGFDSSLFVSQAFRLVGGKYAALGMDASRPRLLVGVLGAFSLLHHRLFAELPTLPTLHLFMLIINCSFLLMTYCFIRRIYSRIAGLLAVTFILCQPIFVQQSIECLADILSGTMILIFFYFADRAIFSRDRPAPISRWIFLGVLGAFTGMGKYTLLPLFPLFVLGVCALRIWQTRQKIVSPLFVDSTRMGMAVLSFVVTLELGHRFLGSWEAGLWADFREAISLGFVLPSLNGIKSRPVTAEPWFYYLRNLWEGQGRLFCAGSLILGTLFFFSGRERGWGKNKPIGLLFIGISLLFVVLHFVLSHKEDRYLLPVYPAIFAVIALPFAHYLNKIGSRFAFFVFPVLGLFLWSSLSHSAEEIQKLDQLSRSSQPTEFGALLSNIQNPPLTGRPCHKLYACEFNLSYLKLDAPIYKTYLPYTEIYTRFCDKPQMPLADLRPFLMNRVIDDIDNHSCFISGRSGNERGASELTNPFQLHVPFQVDLKREDAITLMGKKLPPYDKVSCVKNSGRGQTDRLANRLDCYLMKSYFSGPSIPSPLNVN